MNLRTLLIKSLSHHCRCDHSRPPSAHALPCILSTAHNVLDRCCGTCLHTHSKSLLSLQAFTTGPILTTGPVSSAARTVHMLRQTPQQASLSTPRTDSLPRTARLAFACTARTYGLHAACLAPRTAGALPLCTAHMHRVPMALHSRRSTQQHSTLASSHTETPCCTLKIYLHCFHLKHYIEHFPQQ